MFTSAVGRISAGMVLLCLCSCGGGDGKPQRTDGVAKVSLRLAAEPVEWVDDLVLQIRRIVFVRRNDGEAVEASRPREPAQVSLLKGGPEGATILSGADVPAGDYMSIRIELDAVSNVNDTYVSATSGERCEVHVGDGDRPAALTAYGFMDLREGQEKSFTVVANLHRSLFPADCVAGYALRSNLDIVDDQKAGWFTGRVDPSLVPADCNPHVYVFLHGAFLDDLADVAPPHSNPFSIATVTLGADGYRYRTRPLTALFIRDRTMPDSMCAVLSQCMKPAPYVLAYTCSDDDPVADEDFRFGDAAGVFLNENGGGVDFTFRGTP
jgi:hypothetical protein